jgi:electron transfer flavoprotein alpha subunit
MNPTLGDYRGVWTLSEIRDGKILPVSFELLAWGRDLADKLEVELSAVLLGHGVISQARALIAGGADRVYVVDSPGLEFFNMDSHDKILRALIEEHKPEIILAPATSAGRTVMAVIAAKLHTGLVSDCCGLDIDGSGRLLLQFRSLNDGNIIAAFTTPNHRPQMATLLPGFIQPPAAGDDRRGRVIRKEYPPELIAGRITHLCYFREPAGQPAYAPLLGRGDNAMVDDLVEIVMELERKLSARAGSMESA